jgi:hypothetical protein
MEYIMKKADPMLKESIGEGISEKDAKIYIGQAVAVEIFNVMKHGDTFNLVRYRNNLLRLPDEISD